MAKVPTGESDKQKSKHSALLEYVADQLRCYSEEMMIKENDVLPAFADVLDELAIELDTNQPDHEPANRESALQIN